MLTVCFPAQSKHRRATASVPKLRISDNVCVCIHIYHVRSQWWTEQCAPGRIGEKRLGIPRTRVLRIYESPFGSLEGLRPDTPAHHSSSYTIERFALIVPIYSDLHVDARLVQLRSHSLVLRRNSHCIALSLSCMLFWFKEGRRSLNQDTLITGRHAHEPAYSDNIKWLARK